MCIRDRLGAHRHRGVAARARLLPPRSVVQRRPVAAEARDVAPVARGRKAWLLAIPLLALFTALALLKIRALDRDRS